MDGGHATQYTARVARSLADLERRTTDIVDPEESGSRRRRTIVDGCRQVEALTESQHRKIVTACNTLARHRDADAARDKERLEKAKERIGGPIFAWVPEAGVGHSGDWRAAVELMERPSSDGSRATNVSAIRTLLDAAATHG